MRFFNRFNVIGRDMKIIMAWSGGKDSASALLEIVGRKGYDVVALLATVTEDYGRVSMHGVRKELLMHQADSLGYPLIQISIPTAASLERYDDAMRTILSEYRKRGVVSVVFGDIFLEDVKRYRQEHLAQVGMDGLFPLWKCNTQLRAAAFIDDGFRSIVTCVDTQKLDKSYAGRIFDRQFLKDLPSDVDPCGENGEFHSFVYDGPLFERSIPFRVGEKCLRDNRFYYCDLLPM